MSNINTNLVNEKSTKPIAQNNWFDDDDVKETPLNVIKERILKKEMIAADEDELESQTYIEEKNRKNPRVYFRLLYCVPKPNYYIVLVLICAALLDKNNLSYFYTDDQLNLGLVGVNAWWN
jgi:hypothetical protein